MDRLRKTLRRNSGTLLVIGALLVGAVLSIMLSRAALPGDSIADEDLPVIDLPMPTREQPAPRPPATTR
ncbi:MAG: hypothetical protein JHC74_04825, partial [Thermoleophilia bacterium]|nr:hypothetical protein [Thermoleophilia bacterium]